MNGAPSFSWVSFTYPFNMTRSPAGTVCAGFTESAKPKSLIVTGSEADKANPSGGGRCGAIWRTIDCLISSTRTR